MQPKVAGVLKTYRKGLPIIGFGQEHTKPRPTPYREFDVQNEAGLDLGVL